MKWLPVKRYIATIAVSIFLILCSYLTFLTGAMPEPLVPVVSLIVDIILVEVVIKMKIINI